MVLSILSATTGSFKTFIILIRSKMKQSLPKERGKREMLHVFILQVLFSIDVKQEVNLQAGYEDWSKFSRVGQKRRKYRTRCSQISREVTMTGENCKISER